MIKPTEQHHIFCVLKRLLLEGEIRPGSHITPAALADQFFVSITPVREALLQLTSEGLVNFLPNSGFFARELCLPENTDLLEAQSLLIEAILAGQQSASEEAPLNYPPPHRTAEKPENRDGKTINEDMHYLYLTIASLSGNGECLRWLNSINERCWLVSRRQLEFFSELRHKFIDLEKYYLQREMDKLPSAYHDFQLSRLSRLSDLYRKLQVSD